MGHLRTICNLEDHIVKNKIILITLIFGIGGIAASSQAQTYPYQVKLLGIDDGRTSIQISVPAGLNRWGQVIGTYGTTSKHAALFTATANIRPQPDSVEEGFDLHPSRS